MIVYGTLGEARFDDVLFICNISMGAKLMQGFLAVGVSIKLYMMEIQEFLDLRDTSKIYRILQIKTGAGVSS